MNEIFILVDLTNTVWVNWFRKGSPFKVTPKKIDIYNSISLPLIQKLLHLFI